MIIDDVSQLSIFDGGHWFLYPILEDNQAHPLTSRFVGVVLVDTKSSSTYSISVNHPEGVFHITDLHFLSKATVHCFDLDHLRYQGWSLEHFIDAKLQYYLKTNKPTLFDTPPIVRHYERHFPGCRRVGSMVGLQKHEEIASELYQRIGVTELQPGYLYYKDQIAKPLSIIESNGLHVDVDKFVSHFHQSRSLVGQLCHTQYNMYTTTGRPSNRFDGINFAALNKEDQSRASFTSRFGEQGTLLELDFNAYHPRLIANMVGYSFGGESVYKHLASLYHSTDQPTAEQIKQAKQDTFRQLYGGIRSDYLKVPFFFAANELSKQIWQQFNQEGFVESQVSGRRLYKANFDEDLEQNTLFNYFIQMYETEVNGGILGKLIAGTTQMKAIPVLYTYDSLLIDVVLDQVQRLVSDVIPKCVDLEQFPIKINIGNSYDSMHDSDLSAYLLQRDQHVHTNVTTRKQTTTASQRRGDWLNKPIQDSQVVGRSSSIRQTNCVAATEESWYSKANRIFEEGGIDASPTSMHILYNRGSI